MKILSFIIVLVFFGAVSPAGATNTDETGMYEQVLSSSPLVPATKPLQSRTPYKKSNYYINLKKYADTLEAQVKKEYRYNEDNTTKVKKIINDKLAKSLQSIKNRKEFSRKKIVRLAKQRIEQLYNAIQVDYDQKAEQINMAYNVAIKKAHKVRQTKIFQLRNRTKKAIKHLKQLNKKRKKLVFKRIQKKYQKTRKAILNQAKKYISTALSEKEVAESANDEQFDARTTEATNVVNAEQEAAMLVLNTATSQELDYRKAQRERLQKAINYLSKGTAGKIGENSTESS